MPVVRSAIAVAAVCAGLVAAVTPAAHAVTNWEPGYTPTCGTGSAGAYVDTATPTLSSLSTVRYVVQGTLKPTAPRSIGSVGVQDNCSGVKDVRITYTLPAGFGYPSAGDSRTYTLTGSWHSATINLRVGIPWNAYGKLVINTMRLSDRFNWFYLNSARTSVVDSGGPSHVKYLINMNRVVYLVKQTQLRATLVPLAGGAADVHGSMRNADCDADCGFGQTEGVRVLLQSKGPADWARWITVDSAVTDSSGAVTFHRSAVANPGRYRLVFTGDFTSRWLAPVTSNEVLD